jgi:Ca2+/Na+ antiporter
MGGRKIFLIAKGVFYTSLTLTFFLDFLHIFSTASFPFLLFYYFCFLFLVWVVGSKKEGEKRVNK